MNYEDNDILSDDNDSNNQQRKKRGRRKDCNNHWIKTIENATRNRIIEERQKYQRKSKLHNFYKEQVIQRNHNVVKSLLREGRMENHQQQRQPQILRIRYQTRPSSSSSAAESVASSNNDSSRFDFSISIYMEVDVALRPLSPPPSVPIRSSTATAAEQATILADDYPNDFNDKLMKQDDDDCSLSYLYDFQLSLVPLQQGNNEEEESSSSETSIAIKSQSGVVPALKDDEFPTIVCIADISNIHLHETSIDNNDDNFTGANDARLNFSIQATYLRRRCNKNRSKSRNGSNSTRSNDGVEGDDGHLSRDGNILGFFQLPLYESILMRQPLQDNSPSSGDQFHVIEFKTFTDSSSSVSCAINADKNNKIYECRRPYILTIDISSSLPSSTSATISNSSRSVSKSLFDYWNNLVSRFNQLLLQHSQGRSWNHIDFKINDYSSSIDMIIFTCTDQDKIVVTRLLRKHLPENVTIMSNATCVA